MATKQELIEVSKKLKAFQYNVGEDAQAKMTRYVLYLHLWLLEFTNNKELRDNSANFITLLYHHNKQREEPTHFLIAECIDNEVSKREDKSPKGLKFPKFLENNKNLDKLIKYLEFLLTNENKEILNENTKTVEEIAAKKADEILANQLNYIYDNITYQGKRS